MRRRVYAVTILLSIFPLAASAQHSGRHGASTGTAAPAASPEGEDVATFKHLIAVQATEDQTTQFHVVTKSTEAARQQAYELHQPAVNSLDSVDLTHKVTGLQAALEQAESEYQTFRKSLSDSQEEGLKELTKKLTKSNNAVERAANSISQQVNQGALNAGKVETATEHMESMLAAFQSDLVNLGKEMGIQSH